MLSYRISGLSISSEVELPGVLPGAKVAQPTDVAIRRACVPAELASPVAAGPNWQLAGGAFLLAVPGVARFLVSGGREILMEPDPGVAEEHALPFLLGTAFGVLLQQRGGLVLHGAAVAEAGRAYLFCGKSGAGKSTLTAALCREGCGFVTDDICAVGFDAQGRPVVQPDGRCLKLWADAVDWLGFEERRGAAVRPVLKKHYVEPPGGAAPAGSLPVAAVYILREARPPHVEGIAPVPLADAAQLLLHQAYRRRLIQGMGTLPEYFGGTAALLAHARVFWLTQPRELARLPETVALLRAGWRAP